MATAAKFVQPIAICLAYLIQLDVDATATILNFFSPPTAATHYSGYSYKISWKESKIILNPPFYVSMAAAAKFVQPNPIFFGLSRSTSCGCCSYQVSSISVQRVNCYDHFCVFQFFSILAVSMATAAILIKKSTLTSTTSHGIWYSYKVS